MAGVNARALTLGRHRGGTSSRVCVAATIHTPRPDMSKQPGEWRGPWHGPVSSTVPRPVHPLHTARTLPERLAHDPHAVHTARTPARPRLALRRALSSQVDTGHQASFPSTAGGSRLHHLRHAPLDPAPGVRLKVSLSELHAKTVLNKKPCTASAKSRGRPAYGALCRRLLT